LSRMRVEQIFKKYSEQLGFDFKITPHVMRHTFATHLVEKGMDLRYVQELLGHKKINSTGIYTNPSEEYRKGRVIMVDKYWVLKNDSIDKESLEIVNDYLLSKKAAKLAETTVTRSKREIEIFLLDCGKPIKELTKEDVLSYINTSMKGLKEKSVRCKISFLDCLFKFCLFEGHIDKKLIKSRWKPKLPKSLPKYLEKQEQAKLKLKANEAGLRNELIYELFRSTGCRRSEIWGLRR